MRSARDAGAQVVALVNAESSPLGAAGGRIIPLARGPERSVAATKSFIASLAAIVQLVASWTGDDELDAASARPPAQLEHAWELDWSAALALLCAANNLYVIGRGLGLAVAQEAALKSRKPAACTPRRFSAAEVRHGPMALVRAGFPVLVFAQDDETRGGIEQLAADLATRVGRGLDRRQLGGRARSRCPARRRTR